MTGTVAPSQAQARRQWRMAVLSRCDGTALATRWAALAIDPAFQLLRGPETGLVMLRGRIGGTGEMFNLGEATVTRATVQLAEGGVGHAMALGRDARRAQLSAVIDALCQGELAERLDAELIAPLAGALEAADAQRREEVAATKVDFFTVARGED
jgi:alpha-D-ribose 1-methylphosphonate 5-triphosphate synthase subunit PhnG